MNTRRTRLFAALALPLALAACQQLGGGGNNASTPSLAVGDTVSGEITSSSGMNHNDGSRHQGYRMSLKSGQAVALELGGALKGHLAVFDGQTLLASATTHNIEGEGEGGAVSLAFRAPKDGTYLVAVNGISAAAFGPFKLQAEAVTPYDGKPLTADSEAIDWLVNGDGKQEYKLQLDKPGIYAISMDSSALDPYLRLNGRNVELEDDDGGDGTNARIRTYLEPGEYTLAASTINGNTGSFKLRVALTPVEGDVVTRNGTTLTLGQATHAMLDGSGRRSFVLNLDSPRHIRFDAISDTFDTVLYVTGPGIDAEDDDGGNRTNSRLSLHLGAGRYNVAVSGFGSQQGLFQLETADLGSADLGASGSNRKDAAEAAATAAAEAAVDAAAAVEID